jgi:energy-coupling factor transporter ATP-binding protein EcfA2
MSSQLVLPSLEIRWFRAFRKLEIERLGRVNLIVGKNNVGKTSVLEALNLYANPGSPGVLLDLISTRDEFHQPHIPRSNGRRPTPVPIGAIFHGREAIPDRTPAISIGPIGDASKTLRVAVTTRKHRPNRVSLPAGMTSEDVDEVDGLVRWLSYQVGGQPPVMLPIDDSRRFSQYERVVTSRTEALIEKSIISCYVKANGLDPEWTARAWTSINLTDYHNDITNSLRIIEPLVAQTSANVNTIDRLVPIVRLEGSSEPITLRSMGDGMVRLFNVALALVNSKGGILLVDEIENGLHYSIHEDLWKLVFKTARDLNVQVFATTHSWDCIEAFQRAACEDTSSEGYLIRLGWRRDDIVATVYDESDLAIVTRDHIEVR